MKPITRSWLWIAIALLFTLACAASAMIFSPVLGGVTALLGWLMLIQNPSGGLRPGSDKVWHLLAGAAIAGVTLPHGGVLVAGVTCCTIAVLKEAWCDNQRGVPSFADFLWTCAGGVVAIHVWLVWQL